MKQLLISLVLGFTAMVVSPSAASACSCLDRRPTTAQQYRQWLLTFDGAVFQGTVLSVEPFQGVEQPFQPGWTVTFQVDRHWKGITSPQIVIYTSPDDGLCGIRFDPRRVYLVAAAPRDGRLIANVCTVGWFYTRDPEAFRAALGEGSPPPAP